MTVLDEILATKRDEVTVLHRPQTRDLLQKLLEEEQGRAGIHEELRRSAEGGDRQA